jgi:hypothetical protein
MVNRGQRRISISDNLGTIYSRKDFLAIIFIESQLTFLSKDKCVGIIIYRIKCSKHYIQV